MKYTVQLFAWMSVVINVNSEVLDIEQESDEERDNPYLSMLPPAICKSRPSPYAAECCIKPHLFANEAFVQCGIPIPTSSYNCTQLNCILEKYNLAHELSEGSEITYLDHFFDYIDAWVRQHIGFDSFAKPMKEMCGGYIYRYRGNSDGQELCALEKLLDCYSEAILFMCPVYKDEGICRHMAEYKALCSYLYYSA